jgi:hypothetical protein
MAETFADNLMRLIAAQQHALLAMNAAKDVFGKSYVALSQMERAAIDQMVVAAVVPNYNTITPQFLATQQPQQPMGFPIQPASPTPEKT